MNSFLLVAAIAIFALLICYIALNKSQSYVTKATEIAKIAIADCDATRRTNIILQEIYIKERNQLLALLTHSLPFTSSKNLRVPEDKKLIDIQTGYIQIDTDFGPMQWAYSLRDEGMFNHVPYSTKLENLFDISQRDAIIAKVGAKIQDIIAQEYHNNLPKDPVIFLLDGNTEGRVLINFRLEKSLIEKLNQKCIVDGIKISRSSMLRLMVNQFL